jgi:phosphoribosyl 1,2-cyclic phosphodiesterase
MKVKFWGVRGSIPTPGPHAQKYGGNTTCIEVRTDDGELFIIDGGTGIHTLGTQLAKEGPSTCSVLVTHTHWDHIQGLPFFSPLFIPGREVGIYGTFDPVYGKSLREILSGQMEYCYFPVREAELKAEVNYTSLRPETSFEVGNAKITPVPMNHPVLTFGYVIEADNARVFYTGDHEPLSNIYDPDDEEFVEYSELLEIRNESIERHLQGIDVLIGDAMYTEEEYPEKVGWGHGTHDSVFALAQRVTAKTVIMTHHEPFRTDADLDTIFDRFQALRTEADPQVLVAYEGMELLTST